MVTGSQSGSQAPRVGVHRKNEVVTNDQVSAVGYHFIFPA
jgi:hypothetical protein